VKILLDLNLSPEWRLPLEAQGHVVAHWADLGSPSAPDHEIMKWAADAGFIVFTHDLDFSAILAATQGTAPSVLQMRTQAPTPAVMVPRHTGWEIAEEKRACPAGAKKPSAPPIPRQVFPVESEDLEFA